MTAPTVCLSFDEWFNVQQIPSPHDPGTETLMRQVIASLRLAWEAGFAAGCATQAREATAPLPHTAKESAC